jgi:hypothetical protein
MPEGWAWVLKHHHGALANYIILGQSPAVSSLSTDLENITYFEQKGAVWSPLTLFHKKTKYI